MRKFQSARLLVATHNIGKMEEIAELFGSRSFDLVSAADIGLSAPAETAGTFIGNARIKAHTASLSSGLVALADDSGICIDAIDGAPGVHTADWAEGPDGRNFDKAMLRICDMLESLSASGPQTAHFVCAFVLAWPDGHEEIFEGVVDGQIVCPGRGALGHGYDPIFLPNGHAQTFGEMDRWAKNRISHRARAFEQLVACFT